MVPLPQREVELRGAGGYSVDAASRPVLVATALDGASAVAMERGRALADGLGAQLRVVHVSRNGVSVAEVVEWAGREAGVSLEPSSVTVREGSPVGEIWREAFHLDAGLLVLGGTFHGRPPGWIARFLAQHARRPVLIASESHRPTVVAATDLSDRSLPVLKYAAAFAQTTGARLHAVHNVEPESAANVRMNDLAGAMRLQDLRISSEKAPSDAALRLARSSDADVVAVGAHETSGRTLRELLLHARRSVLAVPLGHPRRHRVTS